MASQEDLGTIVEQLFEGSNSNGAETLDKFCTCKFVFLLSNL